MSKKSENVNILTNPLCERLRKAYDDIGQHYGYVGCIDEAADEIEQLQAKIEAARKILEPLHDCDPDVRERLGIPRWGGSAVEPLASRP